MELGDTILSTEQYSPLKNKQKNKKNVAATVAPPTTESLPTKYTKVIPSSKPIDTVAVAPCAAPKPEEMQILYQQQTVVNSAPVPDFDDPDMPDLEFLDVEEELRDIAAAGFDERSPFIPGPFSDFDLKNRNIGDLLSDIDESELINRAPYIPSPCIDKIVSYDELSIPDMDDKYMNAPFPFNLQEGMATESTASFMDANGFDSSQLYNLGGVKVPSHLLKRFLPAKTGKSDIECWKHWKKDII